MTNKVHETARMVWESQYTMMQILRDLENHTDRELAIVGGSILETCLENMIKTHMIYLPKDLDEHIFEGFGPLSNFSAKIEISHALGQITKSIRDNLNAIKRIRNKFAHDLGKISFENQIVKKYCDNITLRNESDFKNELENIGLDGLSYNSDISDRSGWKIVLTTKSDIIFAGINSFSTSEKTNRARFLDGVSVLWMLVSLISFKRLTQNQDPNPSP